MRGPKPKGKVRIKWSGNFAYAVGLLATDGCLSKDERHIILTSKDHSQLTNFLTSLKIKNYIGYTTSGVNGRKYARIQFGDVLFYRFLQSIGLTPAKSLTLGKLKIPKKYFFDFLRGCFDGDGSSYSYWDLRWRSSFMFYVSFASASPAFIEWIRDEIYTSTSAYGHITHSLKKNTYYQLKYAKRDGLKVLKKMYHRRNAICLSRKRLKIEKTLRIIGKSL